jgi:prevent-host-death family protein
MAIQNHQMDISVTQFKHRCLEIIRRVEESGQPVAITRRGKVVARLNPSASSIEPSHLTSGFRGPGLAKLAPAAERDCYADKGIAEVTERTMLEMTIRAYAAAWAARDREAWLRTFATDAIQEDPSAFRYAGGTARSAGSGIERWPGTGRSRSSLVRSS